MSRKLNFIELTLDQELNSTDQFLFVTASPKLRKGQDVGGEPQYYDLGPALGLLIQQFRATITELSTGYTESIGVDVVTHNGNTDDDEARNKYKFQVEMSDDAVNRLRGMIQNEDGTNSVNNRSSALIVTQFQAGAKVRIVWDVSEQNRLENEFENTTNLFNRPLEASQGSVAAGVVVSLNSSEEFEKGFSGTDLYITVESVAAPNNIDAARYFASGFTPPGSPGDDVYGNLTTGALSATGGAGKKKIGTHAVNSAGVAGVSILPEADGVELTQNQIENPEDATFGLTSGQRDNQGMDKNRPLLTAEFSSDMSDLVRCSNAGTGTESIVATGFRMSCTTGQYSSFEFSSGNFGIATGTGGDIIGRKIFKFNVSAFGAMGVDDQELFFGIAEALPTTTTIASVDSGFAGFQVKEEAGVRNVYAITKQDNANMTRELVATGFVAGDVFIIDFSAADEVKYYITKSGVTTLEATHDTVANIPTAADRMFGWLFNGAGSGTPNFDVGQVSVYPIT